MGMYLYMHDYANSLMALGTKHFNSLLVKRRCPSQRSRFNYGIGKPPMTTLLMIGYVIVEKTIVEDIGLGYRSEGQNTSFCICRTKCEVGLGSGSWRRAGMNNLFCQKEFLINSETQNSRKVFPG